MLLNNFNNYQRSLIKTLIINLSLASITIPSYAKQQVYTKPIYKFTAKNGVTSFSDIAPTDVYYQIANLGCYACKLTSQVDWQTTRLYHQDYNKEIQAAALKHSVDIALVKAIIHAESHFRVQAVSKQGAQGLMQLMPATARELGVSDPFNAEDNIEGGVKHLARLTKKYFGNVQLAAAAYNAGEGAVQKFRGIPPYPETKMYVERVTILYQRYQKVWQS